MTFLDIPPGAMCERCRIHPATIRKADSVMSVAHGYFQVWCRCCAVKERLRLIEAEVATLPELRTELLSACQDEVQADPDTLIVKNQELHDELLRQWLAAHCLLCGKHYPGQDAMNYAHPHPEGEHCYWPKPEELIAW